MSDVPGVTGTPGSGGAPAPAPETLETAEAAAESQQAFDAALVEEAAEPPLNESQQPETRTAIKRSLRRLETGAPESETRAEEGAVEPRGRPAADDTGRPTANAAPESRDREAPTPGTTRRPAAPTEAAGRTDTPDRGPAAHAPGTTAPARGAAEARLASGDTRVTTGALAGTAAPVEDGAQARAADTPEPTRARQRVTVPGTARARQRETLAPAGTRESQSPGPAATPQAAVPGPTAPGAAHKVDSPEPHGPRQRAHAASTARSRQLEMPAPAGTRESQSPSRLAASEPAVPGPRRTVRTGDRQAPPSGAAPASPGAPSTADASRPASEAERPSGHAEPGTAPARDADRTQVRQHPTAPPDAERPQHTEETRTSDPASSGTAPPGDLTGVVAPAQVAESAPTAAPEAVPAPAAHVAEVARQVADRVLVSVPRPGASDEVRITLNQSVLDGSDIRIFREAGELRVVFVAQTESAQRFLADHRDVLQQTLGDRLRDEHVQVQVETPDRRGAAREDTEGRSRQRYVPQDDSELT